MPMVAKLDELGKPAWIALMILGFVVWWPIGLATLAFIIGSGRMSCWKGGGMTRWHGAADQMRQAGTWWPPSRSSGNRAFDEYRQDTLQRLEEEQREFHDFLARLRMAKDKAEFDQFMAERRTRTGRRLAELTGTVAAGTRRSSLSARHERQLRAVPLRVGGPICIAGAATACGLLGQIDAVPGFWR